MKNYGFKKHRRFELEKKNFGKYSATGVYIFRNSTFKKFIYYFYSVMTLNPLIVEFIKSSDLFFLPNPKQIHPFILQHAPDSFFVLPSLENALISETKKDDFEEQETFGFL